LIAIIFAFGLAPGCSSLSNPVADGIVVSKVPPQLLVESKLNFAKVPLGSLQPQQDEIYKLGPGDVLGIWIGEGILGERTATPQARFFENSELPPALGTPIPVRENGTISLPQLKPIDVRGLTLAELEEKLRVLYTTERKIFKPGQESVIVTLIRRRTYTVFVLREDNGSGVTTGGTGYGILAQQGTTQPGGGTGRVIQLAPGENNILNALTRTGGLPGSGAEDEVIIERGGLRRQNFGNEVSDAKSSDALFVRIPLRIRKGSPIPFSPQDVILHDGDSVYVRARRGEYYYTGGYLPSSQRILPRDEDLDVVQAITQVGGVLVSGLTTGSNLNGNVGSSSGIGQPNPSLVSVLRKTPDGGQINIRVNLNKALRDPAERILLGSGDIVVMQLTPAQALVQYLTGQVQFNFFSKLLTTPSTTINTTATGP
jgi:protein involved in polysaccharide export with SLBB domain